MLILLKI